MEDFNEIQDNLNAEYRNKVRQELKTPAGMKKPVGVAVGNFINKLMIKRNYQVVSIIILAYVIGFGLWSIFANLFSVNTVIIIALCLIAAYWIQIKVFIKKVKLFFYLIKIDILYITYTIYDYIYKMFILLKTNVSKLKAKSIGIFKRK